MNSGYTLVFSCKLIDYGVSASAAKAKKCYLSTLAESDLALSNNASSSDLSQKVSYQQWHYRLKIGMFQQSTPCKRIILVQVRV